MGTPAIACPALEALLRDPSVSVVGVITQPIRPSGRGRRLVPSPVYQIATQYQVPVWTPNRASLLSVCEGSGATIIFVMAYGRLLPPDLLAMFPCVNAHASLLPRYRGASPIQSALLNGDTQTGITYIQMTEGLDEGPVIAAYPIPIMPNDHAGSLSNRLAQTVVDTLIPTLKGYLVNRNQVTAQPVGATYCHKLTVGDRHLQPDGMSAVEMLNRIRAFSPDSGAFVMHLGRPVKILSATIENGHLIPLRVRPDGKKTMSYRDYLLGNAPLF